MNKYLFALIISCFGSIIANIIFLWKKIIKYIRNKRQNDLLKKFWGKEKKINIYYPIYPNPKIGRTMQSSNYYISDEDSKAKEEIYSKLKELGYNCIRKTDEYIDTIEDLEDGTTICVCGPKIDQTLNMVSFKKEIGGNAIASMILKKYSKLLNIELIYELPMKIKTYYISTQRYPVRSPSDEKHHDNTDKALIIKFNNNNNKYILFWGIHGWGTWGAVRAALTIRTLKLLPFNKENFISVVSVKYNPENRQLQNIEIEKSFDIVKPTLIDEVKKPNPLKLGEWISIDKKINGLSYLWATNNNIESIKNLKFENIRPVACEFDLSLDCVCRCPHCVYLESKVKSTLKDIGIAKQVIDKLHNYCIKLLVLTGGGEPTLSPILENIVELAKDKGMHVVLYTNGILLNNFLSYKLLEYKINEIRISLDDISNEHNFLRMHGLDTNKADYYQYLRNNIIKLLDLKSKLSYHTLIGASFLISNQNISNFNESLRVLNDWLSYVGPFDYIVIRPAVRYWPSKGSKQYYTNGEDGLKIIKSNLKDIYSSNVSRNFFISYQRFNAVTKFDNTNAYKKCLASNLWLNIGPDGTAFLCCETKHIPRFSIGNILSDNLDTILNNKTIEQRRNYPIGTSGCPTLLCKPSLQNIIFNNILSESSDGVSSEIFSWLNGMREANKHALAEALIPSVSGIYSQNINDV